MAKDEIAVKKENTFSVVLTDGLNENKSALPQDFNIARFVQNSVALLNGNDTLKKYASQYGTGNIKANLLRGAYLGLDALNSEFYLIPYGDKLQFLVDFRGAIKLIKKYSAKPVDYVKAEVVRNGDEFDYWEEDGEPHYKFHPKAVNDGAIVMAFAIVKYKDGTVLVERMSVADIENTRKQSKMANGMAWKSFYSEMCKKTVIHRMRKRIPLEFESIMQKEIFDEDGAIETGRVVEEAPDVFVESTVVENSVVEDAPADYELPDFLKPQV